MFHQPSRLPFLVLLLVQSDLVVVANANSSSSQCSGTAVGDVWFECSLGLCTVAGETSKEMSTTCEEPGCEYSCSCDTGAICSLSINGESLALDTTQTQPPDACTMRGQVENDAVYISCTDGRRIMNQCRVIATGDVFWGHEPDYIGCGDECLFTYDCCHVENNTNCQATVGESGGILANRIGGVAVALGMSVWLLLAM